MVIGMRIGTAVMMLMGTEVAMAKAMAVVRAVARATATASATAW